MAQSVALDLVEIVAESLDLGKYINAVRDPRAGAIATFSGTTRDTFENRPVLRLEYEAYIPMATRQLEAICQAARGRWSLIALAVAHRVGVVPIGDESVFVAVSSVHRKDALEACHFVIDEIKASVAIWKKEIYANGEVWKENTEFFVRNLANPDLHTEEIVGENTRTTICCSRERNAVTDVQDISNGVPDSDLKESA